MRHLLVLISAALAISLSSGCEDKTISPCEGVDCANGTTCNDGDCNCPPRYEGRECRQENTPATMQITEVRISDFPQQTPEGNDWDPSSNPDVFFVIADTNNEVKTSGVIENAEGDEELVFNSNNSEAFPIGLGTPTSQYNLFIGELDNSGSQRMDQVKILPYKKGADFPSTIAFNGDQNTKFELNVRYNFNESL